MNTFIKKISKQLPTKSFLSNTFLKSPLRYFSLKSESSTSAEISDKPKTSRKPKVEVDTKLSQVIELKPTKTTTKTKKTEEIKSMEKEEKPVKKSKTPIKIEKFEIAEIKKSKTAKAVTEQTILTKTKSTKAKATNNHKTYSGFKIKDLTQNYLGHCIDPSLPLKIPKCNMAHKNPFLDYIEKAERTYLCENYSPLPVVLSKGKGCFLVDVAGRLYIDFLSAYSAVNQGHCNTNIINGAIEQMNKLHVTSRAFYNEYLSAAAMNICKAFNYEKVLFMNGGVEAVESAMKIARKWAYTQKGTPDNTAKIIWAKGNFHGRTLAVCASSDDKSRYTNFGPYGDTGSILVEYDNVQAIKEQLENDNSICAVFIEPIQGENGVRIPHDNYLREVKHLCEQHNALLIIDEIQTGFGRTGSLLCCDVSTIKPDMVTLGKSMSGGLYPISAVLTSEKIMNAIQPGEHGSTFGGNPLAAAIVNYSLNEILKDDLAMVRNSQVRGDGFGLYLLHKTKHNSLIKEIRGRGLMCAIELNKDSPINASEICLMLMERGILCKPSGNGTIRLSPPLIITEEELWAACKIFNDLFENLEHLYKDSYTPLNENKTHFNFKPPCREALMKFHDRTRVYNISLNTSPISQIINKH